MTGNVLSGHGRTHVIALGSHAEITSDQDFGRFGAVGPLHLLRHYREISVLDGRALQAYRGVTSVWPLV